MRVYIETTIPSYLTAKPSRDLVIAARQQMTREWWERIASQHTLYVSELVLHEAARGNPEAAEARLAALDGLEVLSYTDEANELAKQLVQKGLVPETAAEDAAHIAIATVHDMDILLTWNCAHLANITVMRTLLSTIRTLGYEPPVICTPDEMIGDKADV